MVRMGSPIANVNRELAICFISSLKIIIKSNSYVSSSTFNRVLSNSLNNGILGILKKGWDADNTVIPIIAGSG